MDPQSIAFLQTYIREKCGLLVPDEKTYLIEFRLNQVLEKKKIKDATALCTRLKNGDIELEAEVVDALTTHETLFFRDRHPFDTFLGHILPEIEKKKIINANKKIKVWSAASSTGQEPYSLAMLLKNYLLKSKFTSSDVSILGTDISKDVIQYAKNGVYTKYELERGFGESMISGFVKNFFDVNGNLGELKQEIKDMVSFQCFNLMDSLRPLGSFDVIFCRNVLIYFDDDLKKKIVDGMYNALEPGGCLILGASENLHGLESQFTKSQFDRTFVYQKL